ncbi:MAG: hypothetical protein LC799_06015, partial [Actinobacteria bacterium]|nr:hypothetical protein [Actinomycetota bacterium]
AVHRHKVVCQVKAGQALDVLLASADANPGFCNVQQAQTGVRTVKLRFLGKNSTPTNSPTLYATDQESYVVQGWIVTDAAVVTLLAGG